MRQSQLFTRVSRQVPKDEVSKNAQLLIRAGFIHKEMAGVYSFLPLGLRVLNKVIGVIREEMDGFLQKVRFRNEVGVQNQQEFALGHLGGRFQRAGLEARAVRAVDADGVKAAGLQFLHLAVALFRGVVWNRPESGFPACPEDNPGRLRIPEGGPRRTSH